MEQKENNEEVLKEKTKKLSIKEGIAYSFMDGFGLRYITPYALALGASNSQIGFLSSIPSLFGNFCQLFTSRLIEKYPRKKILAFGVLLQALMWLPLISIGFFFFYKGIDSYITPSLVILIYSILIAFGGILNPIWNSLMNDIVKVNSGTYFGRRNKIIGAFSLVSLLIGGFILDYFKHTKLFIGFCIIFGIAFIARSISAYILSKHYEPELKFEKEYYFSFKQFLKKIPQSNFGRFAVLISLMMFATAIASPFFSVYMLKELNFSYINWTLVVIASSLGSLMFMALWGKFADKYGNIRVIKITGFLISIIPLLWLASPLIIKISETSLIFYLILVELFSGAVWAGFNLSIINFIYDAVTRQRMALCFAYSNMLNGFGVFIGASLGGVISSLNFMFIGLSPILFVFLLSGLARLFVYFIMISKVKEVREVQKYEKGILKKEMAHGLKEEAKKDFLYFSSKWTKPRPT